MKKFMKGCAITALILFVLGIAMAFTAGFVKGGAAISDVVERVTGGRMHVNLSRGGIPLGILVDDDLFFSDDDDRYDDTYDDRYDDIYDDMYDDMYDDPDDYFDDDRRLYDDDRPPAVDDRTSDSNNADLGGGMETQSDASDLGGSGELPSDASGIIFSDSAGAITGLDIELVGHYFETRVSASDMDSIHVAAEGIDSDKIRTYVEKGVLHIESVNNRLKQDTLSGSIILYIPEDQFFDEVDIEIGAGEVSFGDLNAREVSLEAGMGHILVENLRAGELDASVGMGHLEIYDMDVDELDAEVGAGKLTATGAVNRSAGLECGMGNITLTLEGDRQDFNYLLEAAAGSVQLGSDESYSGLAANKQINNHAAKNMEIECALGNIVVQFQQ